MKEYLFLYKSKFNNYNRMKNNKPSSLWDLNSFFSGDYRPYDKDIFTKDLNYYNAHYIYNDFNNNIMYIGFAEWLIDENIDGPSWDEYSNYVNENNSCKISVDNFKKFVQKWIALKEQLPLFAIIYRDDKDYVHCKGFDSEEEMQLFVQK